MLRKDIANCTSIPALLSCLTHYQEEQNLPVAVKTLKTRNEDGLRSLLQEASLMGQLHHPNIVRLCGISTSPDKVCLSLHSLSTMYFQDINFDVFWCIVAVFTVGL